MNGRLQGLTSVLTPVLARLGPVEPASLPLNQAIGSRLAGVVTVPMALPARSEALRTGLAVTALDLVGASLHNPVMLSTAPTTVEVGQALPNGCDAVIDAQSVIRHGPFSEVSESAEPGADVRQAGHDLAAGTTLGPEGTRVTAEIALVAGLAGLSDLPVRQPVVRLEGHDGPVADWLATRLQALGAVIGGSDLRPDLLLRRSSSATARLALRPAQTGWIALDDGIAIVEMPGRFDGVLAVYLTLVLPILARLTGASVQNRPLALTRKISSQIGMSELVLLRSIGDQVEPLAVGDLPLSACLAADAFCIVPAGLEGYPEGSRIAVTMLEQPLS